MKAQPQAHGRAEAHAQEHHVPVSVYLRIALVLAVITAIEFGIVYVEALKPVMVPILLVLSALKFGLVAAYFMHLKFDHRLLTSFFLIGVILAAAITVALKYIHLT